MEFTENLWLTLSGLETSNRKSPPKRSVIYIYLMLLDVSKIELQNSSEIKNTAQTPHLTPGNLFKPQQRECFQTKCFTCISNNILHVYLHFCIFFLTFRWTFYFQNKNERTSGIKKHQSEQITLFIGKDMQPYQRFKMMPK